ncbi:C40 family peptidase [Pseudomonas japonica]|uniref:C40 family peptidase n=1 Tax=Pseudomonas japonica TaxID=256466 RepID=UPI003821C0FD
MSMMARIAVLSLAALLGACSSHAPTPPQVVQPAYVPAQITYLPAADDVLFRALGLVGTPYRWGGNTPDSGFDCSGLIGYVYRDAAGIKLPRSTRELIVMRAPDVGRDALQSGDLVFFATNGASQVNHAGIYVGEGRFVHAPSTGGTVRLDYLANSYWQRSYLNAKRVLQAPEHLARNP